jgi:hypothetical protein
VSSNPRIEDEESKLDKEDNSECCKKEEVEEEFCMNEEAIGYCVIAIQSIERFIGSGSK